MGLPAGATFQAVDDPIDNAGYRLSGPNFEGLLIVTGQGLALPSVAPGSDYRSDPRKVDGKTGETARYRVADPRFPERRILIWTFKGKNDGSGQSLKLDFSCRDSGCQTFDLMVRSLKAS